MSFSILDQVNSNLNLKRVSIEEFAESDKFCGKMLYPRQKLFLKLLFLEELTGQEEDILDEWIGGGYKGEVLISPKIRERVQWLRDHEYPHFREVIMVGGRRSSKGFLTGIAMAYRLYNTLMFQDPGIYYGIDPDKEIYYTCVAASQEQAKKYQYADFSSMVRACKSMEDNLRKMHELEFSVATEADKREMEKHRRHGRIVGRDISKLRGSAVAANASTIRGSATQAIAFDEFAHMQQGESNISDEEVYEAAIPALAQFGADAMIFCNSSPYTKVGKFYERHEEAMRLNDDHTPAAPMMMTMQFPSWSLFEGYQEDPLRRFRKAITVSPDWNEDRRTEDGKYFFSRDDRQAIQIAREEEKQNPDKYKVERRGQFAEVIDAFLNPEQVDRMYKGVPFRESGELRYRPLRTNWSDSTYLKRYKAHMDPSSSIAGFGFALGHTEPFEDGEHVVFDIIKKWEPASFPSGVIEWEPVMEEVLGFIEIFRPYEVTMDQFNSKMPIQWLQRACREGGYETRVYEKTATATVNWNKAEIFRTALYRGLVHAPHDTDDAEFSALELKYLQEVKTGRVPRVDKQDIGPVQRKDQADAIMECVDALIGNLMAKELREGLSEEPIRPAAFGGYPLGGLDRGGKGNVPPQLAEFYSRRGGEQASRAGSRGQQDANPARRRNWGARPGRRSARGF